MHEWDGYQRLSDICRTMRNAQDRNGSGGLPGKAIFVVQPVADLSSARYNVRMENKRSEAKGRGSNLNPPNRFGGPLHVLDLEQVEHDREYLEGLRHRPTEYIPDRSRSIVTENDTIGGRRRNMGAKPIVAATTATANSSPANSRSAEVSEVR